MKDFELYTLLESVDVFIDNLITPFFILFLLNELRIPMVTIGLLLGARNVLTPLLSIPANFIGDTISRKLLMAISGYMYVYIMYQYTLVRNLDGVIFLFALGIVGGALGSVGEAFFAELTKGEDKGKKIGMNDMFVGIAMAASIAVGAMVIQTFGYRTVFLIVAGANIFTTTGYFFVNPKAAE